jgi:DNA adenine methylase
MSYKKPHNMKLVPSPLRYPGSKVRIAEMIAGILERNLLVGGHLYEPFAGGSGITLNLLANNFISSATWVELDPMVYAFWKTVKDDPESLIARMQRGKVTLAAWQRMTYLRAITKPTKKHLLALAYGGLFFNRTCFSGIIGAGPIGGMTQESEYKIDCRFNKEQIASNIRGASKLLANVEIVHGDGVDFLEENCLRMKRHSVVYIDPPYVANGHKLYRYFFDETDHERLADVVDESRVPWLLSYDNHALVRELYFEQRAKFVRTYQSLKGSRFAKEILLMSPDLLLPSRELPEVTRPDRLQAEILDYEH